MPRGSNPNSKKSLISLSKRTKEERKVIATKGAEATNKLLKEKKTLKQTLEIALELMKENKLKKLKDADEIEFLAKTDALTFEICKMIKDIDDPNIKLKAIENMQDRLYGKPKQEVENKGGLNITGITFKVEK